MGHTDVDAYAAELPPPTVTIGGAQHVGRHLSFEEWIVLEGRLGEWRKEKSPGTLRTLVRELTDALFPPPAPPWRPWWVRWPRRVWRALAGAPPGPRSVADLLLTQPVRVQLRALEDFMDAQAKALELPTPRDR